MGVLKPVVISKISGLLHPSVKHYVKRGLSFKRILNGHRWGQILGTLNALGGTRSVLFLHNSYYHFYYLAKALRRRGWDALTVSLEDPNGPNANYYHGEDVNLFSPDPLQFYKNIEEFFAEAIERFRFLHFAGDGVMSFFPENWGKDEPWDIIKWRRRGHKNRNSRRGLHSLARLQR